MEIKTLDELKSLPGIKVKNVTFNFPNLDEPSNEMWSKRFNDLLNECGCSSGQQYLLYATPVFIIATTAVIAFTPVPKKMVIVSFILALVITGVTGKIAGIIERNRKLKSLANEFYQEAGNK